MEFRDYPSEDERMQRANDYRLHSFKGDGPHTQCYYALDYLFKYQSITPLEALNAFGCMRLGARISDLRADGYDIETEIHKGRKNYAIYRLRQDGDEYE